MVGETDNRDKKESRKLALVLVALVSVLGVAFMLLLPALTELVAVHFEPGLGLKSAALISFFVTVAVLLVFALASGDGLLGELQFVLGAFFLFFLFFWLMLAWIF